MATLCSTKHHVLELLLVNSISRRTHQNVYIKATMYMLFYYIFSSTWHTLPDYFPWQVQKRMSLLFNHFGNNTFVGFYRKKIMLYSTLPLFHSQVYLLPHRQCENLVLIEQIRCSVKVKFWLKEELYFKILLCRQGFQNGKKYQEEIGKCRSTNAPR